METADFSGETANDDDDGGKCCSLPFLSSQFIIISFSGFRNVCTFDFFFYFYTFNTFIIHALAVWCGFLVTLNKLIIVSVCIRRR